MKVIFLDIDGVLNSVRYDRERTPEQDNIDESRLPLLKRIVDETGAVIVLSSSWRKHWEQDAALCDDVGRRMVGIFRKYDLRIAGKTPQIEARKRAEEIEAWLNAQTEPVEAFVILDDIAFGWEAFGDHLIKTNERIGRGLEAQHVQMAIELLNGKD